MKTRNFVLLFVFMIAIAGCKENGILNTTAKGNIIGSLNLYDEGTAQISKDGMTVSVDGSNPEISAVTNTSGSFVLSNVPLGTYNITFNKNGFGAFKKIGVVHSNTSSTIVSPSPSLGQISTTRINNLSKSSANNIVTLTIRTLPAPSNQTPRYIRIFYSNSADVSFDNYRQYSGVYSHRSNPADLEITKTDFNEMGFSSGETVYARVYGDSYWSNDYENTATGKRVFPNLNTTTVSAVSFVVP